jgi:hypothetical protein
MADGLALALGAQRRVLPGAGHAPHHLPAFNPALEQLMLGQSLYR